MYTIRRPYSHSLDILLIGEILLFVLHVKRSICTESEDYSLPGFHILNNSNSLPPEIACGSRKLNKDGFHK
jgi:hypothetical protein